VGIIVAYGLALFGSSVDRLDFDDVALWSMVSVGLLIVTNLFKRGANF